MGSNENAEDQQRNTSTRSAGKIFIHFVRKNWITLLLVAFGLLMILSPTAKSWVLQKFMLTGVFNAHIKPVDVEAKNSGDTADSVAFDHFSFRSQNGKVQSTTDLKGKVVFINFWATWCPPCVAEFPSIQKAYDKFKNNPNIFFLLLNEDGTGEEAIGKVHDFIRSHHYSLPIFRTHGHLLPSVYSGTLPTTLILNKEGKVVYKKQGFANYGSERFLKQLEELMED